MTLPFGIGICEIDILLFRSSGIDIIIKFWLPLFFELQLWYYTDNGGQCLKSYSVGLVHLYWVLCGPFVGTKYL